MTTQPLHVDEGITYVVSYWARGYGRICPLLYSTGPFLDGGSVYDTIASDQWTQHSRTIICSTTTDIGEFMLYVRATVAPEHVVVDDFMVDEYVVPVPPYHSIQEIQTPVSGNDSYYQDSVVATSGIVTGVSQFGSKFYLQNGTGPYSGLFINSNPPGSPQLGDEILVYGTVEEFRDWSTLYPTITSMTDLYYAEVLSTDNPQPAPQLMPMDQIGDEQWEGVLARVEGFYYTGWWFSSGWLGTNDVDSITVHDLFYDTEPELSVTYSIEGVLHRWGKRWSIEPRGPFDVGAVGIGEDFSSGLRVYPNPADDFVIVDIGTAGIEPLAYTVVDPIGQIVVAGVMTNRRVSLSELKSGAYVLALKVGDGLVMHPFLIQH